MNLSGRNTYVNAVSFFQEVISFNKLYKPSLFSAIYLTGIHMVAYNNFNG